MNARQRRIAAQQKLLKIYLTKLQDAGMTKAGVAVQASHMAIAIILEQITPRQMVPIVEEALKLQTAALMIYQRQVEDDLDERAVEEAAREMNEALNEVYGDDEL